MSVKYIGAAVALGAVVVGGVVLYKLIEKQKAKVCESAASVGSTVSFKGTDGRYICTDDSGTPSLKASGFAKDENKWTIETSTTVPGHFFIRNVAHPTQLLSCNDGGFIWMKLDTYTNVGDAWESFKFQKCVTINGHHGLFIQTYFDSFVSADASSATPVTTKGNTNLWIV